MVTAERENKKKLIKKANGGSPFNSTFVKWESSFGDVCAFAAVHKIHSNVPVSTIPDNDTTTPPI